MPPEAPASSTTTPDTKVDKLVFFAPAQGWGRLKSGTLVFDDGGQLGPGGEVVPPVYERVTW
ncbi:hypothetical protein GCM10010519_01070 [Streptomyces lactacystinicus]|uniref:Uncharacterized protein n=1 Tax=Streptomyces kaniharaensis TaxID=212423 RepID=A0A6N7L0G6_9ACTN|nr:DUF5999 family protein [Streptomyces kaniharaensis]MQS17342.1 hypothetical protein [Streptomyces kaniharaensis]